MDIEPTTSTDTEILSVASVRYAEKYVGKIAAAEAELSSLLADAAEQAKQMEVLVHNMRMTRSRIDTTRMNVETLRRKERRSKDLVVVDGKLFKRTNKYGQLFCVTPHPHYCDMQPRHGYWQPRSCDVHGCVNHRS